MMTTAGPVPFARATHAVKMAYLSIPIWACSMAILKSGIALSMLRIRSSTAWNWFLYFMIAIQIAFAIANTFFPLLQCRPLEAAWNTVIQGGQCMAPTKLRIVTTVAGYVNVATDLILSVAPVRFLIILQKPAIEKILLMLLMSLGLLASAASIRKAIIVQAWGDDLSDMWNQGVAIATLTVSESLLTAFASAAICLRTVLRRTLAHFGIVLEPDSFVGTIRVIPHGEDSATNSQSRSWGLSMLRIGKHPLSRVDASKTSSDDLSKV